VERRRNNRMQATLIIIVIRAFGLIVLAIIATSINADNVGSVDISR